MKLRHSVRNLALVLALACAMAAGVTRHPAVVPEDSCSNWLKQDDGSYWRTCVDDKGNQYCQVSRNNKVTKVSCRISE
jgi:hypothetical protein